MRAHNLKLLNLESLNLEAKELASIKINLERQYINSPRKPLVTYVKKIEDRNRENRNSEFIKKVFEEKVLRRQGRNMNMQG